MSTGVHPFRRFMLALITVAVVATGAAADVRYIYDDLGRLSQVIDEQGNVATYTYDAVGNILSISRSTGSIGAPVITSISPTSGNQSTTVSIAITGQNLQGAAVTTDNPGIAVSNVRTSPASITGMFAIDLTARAGATVVTVKTTIGTATASFTIVPKTPEITLLSPEVGPRSRLVTIFGSGFNPVPAQNLVRFNSSTATVFAATPFRLDTAVPLDAPIGPVSVTVTANLLTSNAKPFVVTAGAPPTITSITPDRGSAKGGERVTIVGTGFVSVLIVKIGAAIATNVVTVNATTLTARTPTGTAGAADVVVTTSGGDARLAGGYTFIAADPERAVAITPTPGLTNAPVNAPVTVLFTRPVERATITTASYSLKVSSTGVAVAGAFSFDQNDTLVTFRPSANLAPTTSYTIALTQDIRSTETIHLDGPFVGSFITGPAPDTVSPTVQVSPANGAANVPFNSLIVFSFSEPINPNTVTLANLKVTNLSIERAGTLTLSQQNTVATFVPASPFVPGTSVTVRLSGNVADVAGNRIIGSAGLGSDFVTSFTTAQTQDVLPPIVLNINPPNNATGISAATTIAATFNESLDPASVSTGTFRVSSNGVPIAGTIVLSNFATVATFLPTSLLPGLSQIDVAIGPGVRDLAGNAMVAAFTSRFTTQSAIDNFQPSVTAVNPPPGATGVPVNARVTIAFSERIDPASITPSSFSLAGPVGAVVGTISIAPNQLSATFTPAQPLLAGGQHTITYTAAIRDLAGNPLLNPTGQLNSVTFTTGGTTSDLGGPTVVTVSPATAAQNVPTNAPVVIQFSEPIAAPSVTDQTVVLSVRGVPVPTTITLEQNNTIVRVASANFIPLQASTFHNLAVTTGVTDLAGNPLAAAFTSGFTTGTGVDTAPPTVVSVSPALDSGNISVTTTISLTFSEALNPTTVTKSRVLLTGGGADGAIAGTLALSADRRTVTLTPSAPLFAGAIFAITTADVEDLAGNHFVMTNPPPVRFATDIAPGTVTGTLPTSATVVPISLALFANGQTVTPVIISNVNRGGTLAPNDTLVAVTAAAAYKTTSAGGTIVGGLPSPDPRFRLFPVVGGTVTLFYQSPSRPDLVNATANAFVQVASVDASGAPVAIIGASPAIVLSASRAATVTTNPINVLANGASLAEVSVTVRDIGNAPAPSGVRVAVTAATVFQPSAGGTLVGGQPATDARFSIFTTTPGGVLTFNYVAPALAPNQAATATIQVAEADDAGNVLGLLGTATINLNGSTGFSGPQPVVLSVSPPNGFTGVGTNTVIAAEFSQPLDPASVTASTFSVSRTNGPVVSGTRVLSAGPRGPNTVVTFSPAAPLTPSVSHSLSITTGVRSAAGTPLLAVSSSTFTTLFGPDNTPPTIVGSNPPDGATGVPTNVLVTLQASEALNASTVNAATITVSQGGIPIGGRVTLGTGSAGPASLITFTPDQVLAINSTYTVTASAGVTDMVGNALAAPFTASFTTGVVVDTLGPTLVSMAPFNGQTNVPLNAHVVVQFDEPVNPTSVHAGTFALSGVFTVPATIQVSADGRTATLIPLQALTANRFHTITLTNGVTDWAGNALRNPPTNQGFTTGGTPTDATGPQILGVSPGPGALDVPTNSRVNVQFSEPVAASTVNSATLSVSANGSAVPGTITLLNSNTIARWTPAAPLLASNKLHTVTVTTGITDVSGNPLTLGSISNFTTQASTNTSVLKVLEVRAILTGVLLNGATNVNVTDSFLVTFDRAVDPTTLIAVLTGGNMDFGLGGTSTFSADRSQLTFTPAQPLFSNGQYALQLVGLTDPAGNGLASQSIASFRAAVAPGTDLNTLANSASLPPTLPSVFANGQNAVKLLVTNVSRSGPLVANGTRVAVSVEPAFRVGTAGGTIVGGTPSVDPRFRLFTTEGGSFSFIYRAPYRPDLINGVSAAVTIQIASVDSAGRPVGLLASSNGLTLVGAKLATIGANPVNLVANGTSTSELTVTLTDPSNFGVPAGVRIGVTAQPVYVGGSAGGTINGGTAAPDARFRLFTITPGGSVSMTYTPPAFAPAQSGTATIQVAEADDAGNMLGVIGTANLVLDGTAGFTAPQPRLLALSPQASTTGVGINAKVVAQFSQPIDPASVSASTFSVTAGAAVAGTRTLSASPFGPNTVLTFTPSALLAVNTTHTISITTGIRSAAGLPLLASSSTTFLTTFATDTVAPTVVQVSPPAGATAVATNTLVTARFSEPMNPVTLDTTSFSVKQNGIPVSGRIVAGSFISLGNTTAVFVPDQSLAPATTYTVALTAAATDQAGNALAPFTWTFTTGAEIVTIPPTVLAVSPFNNETAVPLNAVMTVRFDAPINPVTVNATTLRLDAGNPLGDWPASLSVSPDGRLATLTPTEPLIANFNYTLRYTNGIMDFAGNRLVNPGQSNFTTAGTPIDATGPQVTIVSPADGATLIARNAPVLLQFSEPLAPTTVTADSITVSAGGTVIAGSLSLERPNTVRWLPAAGALLAASTTHTVTVSTAVTDIAGNGLPAPFVSTFTTSALTDATAPAVLSVTPANGVTGVSPTTTVTVVFNEPINPATLDFASTFRLNVGTSFTVPGTFAVSADRQTVVFTPDAPLFETTTYTINLLSIEDRAGNRFGSLSSSFTVGTAPGTNVNTLPNGATMSSNPTSLYADGQTTSLVTITNINRNGVPSRDGTQIAVTAQPTFVQASAGGTIIGGVPSPDPRYRLFSTLGGAVTLTYQSPNRPDLVRTTTATANVQAASVDAAGRPVANISATAITLSATNSVSFTANPLNIVANGTSVSNIGVFVFDRVGAAVPAGVRIAVTALPVHTATSAGGTINGGTTAPDPRFKLFTVPNGGLVEFTYTPPVFAPLQGGTAAIQVFEADAAGNVLGLLGVGTLTLNGTTGFTQPQPTVVAVSPPTTGDNFRVGTNTVAMARFDQPIDPATLNAGTFAIGIVGPVVNIVPGTITIGDSPSGPNTLITYSPLNPLIPNTSLNMTVSGSIRGANGEPLLAAAGSSFVTGAIRDVTAPSVAAVSPPDGFSGVPLNAPISVSFTETANATTIDTTTFVVSLGGTPIPGRVTVGTVPAGIPTMATFVPTQLLQPNTTYTVSVTAGVTDPAGNALAAPFTSTFTTGTASDNRQPTVTYNPPAGSTNVPVTFAPTLTFSEPVNPATVNSGTVFMQGPEVVGAGSTPVTLSLSNNNTVVTLTPVNPLFAGRLYSLFGASGITDLAGNRLVVPGQAPSFTTALAPGTANLPTAATVVANPANLVASGTVSSTILITNITRAGVPVPNGTIVGVTAQTAFTTSAGGTISGASVGTSPDGRFLLFSTLGAAVTVTYTPPPLMSLGPNEVATAFVQVVAVDLDNRPSTFLNQAVVNLSGIQSVTMVVSPLTLPANGTSTATITATFKDKNGSIVPDGTVVGLTVAPIFSASAGGTIVGGTTSTGDNRIQLFTTTGGQISATYRSPTSKGSGQAVIQAVTVNSAGNAMRVVSPTTTVTLQ